MWQQRVRPRCLPETLTPGHPHRHKCPCPPEGDIMSGLSLPREAEPGLHGGRREGAWRTPGVCPVPLTSPAGSRSSGGLRTQSTLQPPVPGRASGGGTAAHHGGSLCPEHSTPCPGAAHGRDRAGPGRVPHLPSDPAPRQEGQDTCPPPAPQTQRPGRSYRATASARPSHCLDETHPLGRW